MTTPVWFILASVFFYIGVTLAFLNEENSQASPRSAVVRATVPHASR